MHGKNCGFDVSVHQEHRHFGHPACRLDAKTGNRYTGEDCRFILLDLIPFGFPNLKESIDQALEKGKGNVMVDEVTEVKRTWLLLGTLVCIDVEGTVLTAPTGNLTKKSETLLTNLRQGESYAPILLHDKVKNFF
jgi:hypothetical protein